MNEMIMRLDRWMKKNRPDYYKKLRTGTSKEKIAKFKKTLKVELSSLYYELHEWKDGDDDTDSFQYNRSYLSLDLALKLHSDFGKLLKDGDFKESGPNWWRNSWIPFLGTSSNDLVCIDTEGVFKGKPGQIIDFIHDYDQRHVIAPNLERWLETFVDSLEAGAWAISEEYGLQERGEKGIDHYLKKIKGFPIKREAADK